MEKNLKDGINKALNGKPLKVNLYGTIYNTVFQVGHYRNGRIAVELIDAETSEPFATLTINIPEATASDNEIIVKTWTENEQVAKAAYDSGLFLDTGKRISSGFVQAQVWKIRNLS
jgi:hypothetical protein